VTPACTRFSVALAVVLAAPAMGLATTRPAIKSRPVTTAPTPIYTVFYRDGRTLQVDSEPQFLFGVTRITIDGVARTFPGSEIDFEKTRAAAEETTDALSLDLWPSLGRTMPTVAVLTRDGRSAELPGSTHGCELVLLWSTYCTVCRRDIRRIADIQAKVQGSPQVVTACIDSTHDDWTDALRKLDLTDSESWKNVFIEKAAMKPMSRALGIEGWSRASYIIGPDNRILHADIRPGVALRLLQEISHPSGCPTASAPPNH
jgi:hypothetical protein